MLGQRFVDWASFFHMHHLVTYVIWSRVIYLFPSSQQTRYVDPLEVVGGGGEGEAARHNFKWVNV